MSILDIFRTQPAQATTQQGADNNQAPQGAQQHTDNQPAGTSNTPAPVEAPLDEFKTLWDTTPTDGQQTPAGVFGEVDPKKIFEAAKGANFAAAIPQETLQAIAAGGDGAVKAMQDALNSTTQAVFAQSTLATAKLVEQAIAKTQAAMEAQLPALVAKHSASDSLRSKNPALSNPAAQPIIAAVQAQLAVKHPNATASQLTEMAEKYLTNFAEVVAPKKTTPTDTNTTVPGEVNWEEFFKS